MNRRIWLVGVISLVVISGVASLWLGKTRRSSAGEVKGGTPSAAVLYYGNTCPHCRKVEDWLEKNPAIKERSGLVLKEVYGNRANSRELIQKAQRCNLDTTRGVGVPFLFDNGRCIIGDQSIINYLKENYQ